MRVTLLGPQRRTTAARAAVTELVPSGPVATINAGWRERESATDELNEVLGGRMINVELFRRWQELIEADPEYGVAEGRLADLLAELQETYALRLQHAMAAIEAVRRRSGAAEVREAALGDAVRTIRDLDRWHTDAVAATRQEFYATTRIGERESVLQHRTEIGGLIADASGLVVTGGHVGVLLHVLHIFGIAAWLGPSSPRPLITWSAGAMALSEQVMLFHDHGPPGRRYPEVYAEGLGAFQGVVPFPQPKQRLPLDDHDQLQVLAARLAPRTAVLLTDGARVDLPGDGSRPPGSRWISADGTAETAEGRDGQG